jgi:enediyne polyketide synthase
MGERLGRIDSLSQQGIQPITPDQGIQLLQHCMTQALPDPSVVVSSRFGALPTIRQARAALPLWRFLEQPRVVYPGIELVVDVELSVATDPYLRDHIYQGECIFPGVFGLEAMTQVAQALAGDRPPTSISDVQFLRPIVVPATQALTIRLAALVRPGNAVEVAIRSAQTGFAVDHFRAVVGFGPSASAEAPPQLMPSLSPGLEIDGHLYGELLFHQGRFQRVQNYEHLRAKSCIALIHTDPMTPWFSDYLPQDLLLGDPGARDAAIHALQACVPHVTILPVGIHRLELFAVDDQTPHRVVAIERSHGADQFVYDLWITAADGQLLERWHGLTLQVIESKSHLATWSAPLLPPYLERCLTEEQPEIALAIALADRAPHTPPAPTDPLWQQLTGGLPPMTRRGDGKPDPIAQQSVSASHCEHLTLSICQRSVSARGGAPQMACDLEQVSSTGERPWQDLLGDAGLNLAQLLAHESGEALEVAVTRIWCARECLKKAGLPFQNTLTLHRHQQPMVWLQSHSPSCLGESTPLAIATWVLTTRELPDPIVIAILTEATPSQVIAAV